MSTLTIIQGVLVVYIIACLGVGVWSSKYQTNTDEFYVAGQRLGPIVLGLAVSSTIMSGMGFVGTVGSIYSGGYPAFNITIWACVGTMLSYLLLAEPLRRVTSKYGAITLSDFAYHRYNSEGARLVVTLATIIGVTGYIMTNLAALGTVVRIVTGWSYFTALTIGTIVLWIYVVMGGMLAAAVTDAFQSVLMMFLGVAFAYMSFKTNGGITNMNETLNSMGQNLTSVMQPGTMYNQVWFIGTVLLYGFGVSGQPHVVNKFYQINKVSTWKKSMFIAVGSYFLVGLSHFAGVGARAQTILGNFPDLLHDTNQVSSVFTITYFTPVIAGVILAAIVAAMMSTCDSQVVTVSSAFMRDFIFRYFYKKKLDDKKELLYTRIAITLFMFIAYLLVFNPPSVLTWIGNGAWGICASVLFPILVLGSRWKRGNKIAATVTGIVGITLSFGLVVLTSVTEIKLPVNAAIIGFIGATTTYIILTLILPSENTDFFDDEELSANIASRIITGAK